MVKIEDVSISDYVLKSLTWARVQFAEEFLCLFVDYKWKSAKNWLEKWAEIEAIPKHDNMTMIIIILSIWPNHSNHFFQVSENNVSYFPFLEKVTQINWAHILC